MQKIHLSPPSISSHMLKQAESLMALDNIQFTNSCYFCLLGEFICYFEQENSTRLYFWCMFHVAFKLQISSRTTLAELQQPKVQGVVCNRVKVICVLKHWMSLWEHRLVKKHHMPTTKQFWRPLLLLLIVVFWNHAVEKHVGQYHIAEINTILEEVSLSTKGTILKSHTADITVVTAKSHMWIFPLRVSATLWEVQNKHFEKGKMSLIQCL